MLGKSAIADHSLHTKRRRKRRAYQLALSGKKTLFRPKEPNLRFFKRRVIKHIEECDDSEELVYIPIFIKKEKDIIRLMERENPPVRGTNWYNLTLFGDVAVEVSEPSKDGNVVLGFTSDTYLMLDVDFQWKCFVIVFAIRYAKFHNLGSVLILQSSDDYLTDLFGYRLGKFLIIFGKPLSWEEIQWHITNVRRLGVIERAFAKLREFGSITIRSNAKNVKIPPPKIIKFYANGDMRGIHDYVQWLNRYKNLGF